MILSEFFNSTKAKSLATTDMQGNPNVCLCGTAYMPDEDTIHIGCALLDRTRENIKITKKAVFMASKPFTPEYWEHYEKAGKSLYPAGYRFYTTFVDETSDAEIIEPIYKSLKKRTCKKIANKLDSVMIFKINQVRELAL